MVVAVAAEVSAADTAGDAVEPGGIGGVELPLAGLAHGEERRRGRVGVKNRLHVPV